MKCVRIKKVAVRIYKSSVCELRLVALILSCADFALSDLFDSNSAKLLEQEAQNKSAKINFIKF
jgi:hypothetical protein